MKRSGTKVSLSAEIHNDNIAQGEVVEDKHTETKEYLKYSTEELTIVCEVCNAALEDKFPVGQHMSYHESSFKPLAATPYMNQTKNRQ